MRVVSPPDVLPLNYPYFRKLLMYLTPETLDFEMVTCPQRAVELLDELDTTDFYALDLETTSLFPSEGTRVRLSQIYNDKISFLIDHDYAGSFEKLVEKYLPHTWIVFNNGFEGRWLEYKHHYRARVWDVGIMRKCRLGGSALSLAIMVERDLKIKMDKIEQRSDWSKPNLTRSQYEYAMYDSYVTWELFKMWRTEMTAGNWEAFHLINPIWRANNEMEDTGLVLDCHYHLKNIVTWEIKKETCRKHFRRFTPEEMIPNMNSKHQMSDFLKRELSQEAIDNWPRTPNSGKVSKKTGKAGKDVLELTRDTCIQAAVNLPYPMKRWLLAYVIYSKWTKYLGTYGAKLVDTQTREGRIKSRFNIMQAVTGRYSSSADNLQNIPRQPYIRKAFIAKRNYGQGERHLVLADYSSVEVRVLAELSQDKQLLEDSIYGDVHSGGAATINGVDYEYYRQVLADKDHKDNAKFKMWRGRAKVFTFRLLYGAGAGALAMSLRSTTKDAQDAVVAWADRYPKAYNYRFSMADEMHRSGFLPICDGRTVYVRKPDRQLPVAANYPVQGAAATVMYRALIQVHRLLYENSVDCKICASVHDELIMDASDEDAEIAMDCLNEGMKLGWLDVFPNTDTANLGDSAIGKSWAAKP